MPEPRPLRSAILLAALWWLLAAAPATLAEPVLEPVLEAGPAPVRLVELFTSEGCSSCPPADRWLARFAEREDLWIGVVPVAWHVSYWDRLGWPDALADRDHDLRQRRLARRNATGVYTPGVFVDGGEWRAWRTRDLAPADGTGGGRLLVERTDAGLVAHFTPLEEGHDALTLELVWLTETTRRIEAGENRGRTLDHAFAALAVQRRTLVADAHGAWRTRQAVDVPTPAAARALVAIVSDARGVPVQSAGAWLGAPIP